MAAEIKVNKARQRSDVNSLDAMDSSGNHQADWQPESPEATRNMLRSPIRQAYDTRDEGEATNMNQRKSYNAKFQFFTKPLGPGHYDPTTELTKPKHQGAGWGAERSPPREEPAPRNLVGHPGPGQYTE